MDRSPHALVVAVAAVDPEHSYSLQVRDGVTECNEAARFLCAALGVPLVRAKANEQRDWLAASLEWQRVDRETARQRIAAGFPTLVVYQNPDRSKHGHIALGVPAPLTDPAGLYVAAAGVFNTNSSPEQRQFGDLPREYFTHD
jgi:hypothetical protein